jgi:malonyl CoA-acyl carrier protein transacylase
MGELIVQNLSFHSLVQLVSVRGDVFGNVLVTGGHGMSEIVGLHRETLV